ncbi:MAG TPA: sigma factor-like helix-turn-helix DNA-binding protein, partial [Acidimicrobiales bacterium]|nr:sigma factor-like helix-turn-helix DNA-binding protein [Acidimicrobiales bacterium]
SDELEESYEERQHRLATAREALDTLNRNDRELIIDHYFHQLPYAEMARRRGRTTGAVAKATNRAVQTLHRWLANRCH